MYSNMVELRLRDTFIDFHPEPALSTTKSRSTSTPPSFHARMDFKQNNAMHTDYLENLVERASRLPEMMQNPEMTPYKDKQSQLEEPTLQMQLSSYIPGWICVCGIHSEPSALFCWNCGTAKQIATKTCSQLSSSQISSSARASKMRVIPIKRDYDTGNVHVTAQRQGSTTDEGSLDDFIQCVSSEDDLAFADGSSQPATTLMVSCLPVRLGIEQLLWAIDSVGFNGTYDLVYMPYRSVKKRGKVQHGSPGYAFVNFKTAEFALEFQAAFEAYPFTEFNSDRKAVVKPATTQGYYANLALHAREKKQHGSIITFT
jgi:hypothetical protein